MGRGRTQEHARTQLTCVGVGLCLPLSCAWLYFPAQDYQISVDSIEFGDLG